MKLFILLTTLFFSSPSFSANIFVPLDTLPVEMQLLTDTLYFDDENVDDFPQINQQITSLDRVISDIPKEHLFFIIKSEIYKFFLERVSDIKPPKIVYTQKLISDLGKKIALGKDEYSPIGYWLIRGLRIEVNQILTSDIYQNEKSNPEEKQKMERKLELLAPLMKLSLDLPPKDFNQRIFPWVKGCLETLIMTFKSFLIGSNYRPAPETSPIKYFVKSKKEIKGQAPLAVPPTESQVKNAAKKQAMEEVADLVVDNASPTQEEPKQNKWTPQGSASLTTILTASETSPQALPTPVNDWVPKGEQKNP